MAGTGPNPGMFSAPIEVNMKCMGSFSRSLRNHVSLDNVFLRTTFVFPTLCRHSRYATRRPPVIRTYLARSQALAGLSYSFLAVNLRCLGSGGTSQTGQVDRYTDGDVIHGIFLSYQILHFKHHRCKLLCIMVNQFIP